MPEFSDESHEGTIQYMDRMVKAGWSQKQVIASVLSTVYNILQLIQMPNSTTEYTYTNIKNVLTGFRHWVAKNFTDENTKKRLTDRIDMLLLRVDKAVDQQAAALMEQLGKF